MQDKLDIKVTIVDYGMGNLRSVFNKVSKLVERPVLSSNPQDILDADRLILPGVGHFVHGMKNLEDMGLRKALEQKVLIEKTPILGICLGMQLFTEFSEEGNCQRLGWIEGKTVHFDQTKVDSPHFKVPHMGWNTLHVSEMRNENQELEEFYFCHSFHVDGVPAELVSQRTKYGYEFTSAFKKDNIQGVQFHPEKSHEQGQSLIQAFVLQDSLVTN